MNADAVRRRGTITGTTVRTAMIDATATETVVATALEAAVVTAATTETAAIPSVTVKSDELARRSGIASVSVSVVDVRRRNVKSDDDVRRKRPVCAPSRRSSAAWQKRRSVVEPRRRSAVALKKRKSESARRKRSVGVRRSVRRSSSVSGRRRRRRGVVRRSANGRRSGGSASSSGTRTAAGLGRNPPVEGLAQGLLSVAEGPEVAPDRGTCAVEGPALVPLVVAVRRAVVLAAVPVLGVVPPLATAVPVVVLGPAQRDVVPTTTNVVASVAVRQSVPALAPRRRPLRPAHPPVVPALDIAASLVRRTSPAAAHLRSVAAARAALPAHVVAALDPALHVALDAECFAGTTGIHFLTSLVSLSIPACSRLRFEASSLFIYRKYCCVFSS